LNYFFAVHAQVEMAQREVEERAEDILVMVMVAAKEANTEFDDENKFQLKMILFLMRKCNFRVKFPKCQ
jgi:hypothetical protein